MHHHGRAELSVGCIYDIPHEPNNTYDSHACAILDGERVVAYVDQLSALVLSKMLRDGLPKDGIMYVTPLYPTEVKSRRLGPQHQCKVAFVAEAGVLGHIKKLANLSPNMGVLHG